jgi:HPt (histidine-containing phosphotransfer) domain-containing protein
MTTIDRATFDELREAVGDEFIAELVDTFATEAPSSLAELRQALGAGDVDGYRRAAHSLKSNCGTFGAHALAERARDVELGGFPDDAAAAAVTIDALADELATVVAELKELAGG